MQSLSIGKILKPQGIKGELKVGLLSDESVFKNIKEVYINSKKHNVSSCNVRFGFAYITLEDINSRNDAELLRNKIICIDKDSVKLENSYFIEDLINYDIINENGTVIGKLIDIEQYGAADVLVIFEDKREYRVPFIKSLIIDVNTQNKSIIVSKQYDEVKICE